SLFNKRPEIKLMKRLFSIVRSRIVDCRRQCSDSLAKAGYRRLLVMVALTLMAAAGFAPTPFGAPLQSWVFLSISGDQNSTVNTAITVPPNTPVLQITTRGGSGDVDLSVVSPDGLMSSSRREGTTETLSFTNPTAGHWQIEAVGYMSFSNVS